MTSPAPLTGPLAGLDLNDQSDLARTITPITLGGQTWQVANDFDSRVGLEMFLLRSLPLGARVRDAVKRLSDDPDIDAIQEAARKATDQYEAQVHHAVSLLFQHSGYTDMTDERTAATFSLAELERILGYFFPLPYNGVLAAVQRWHDDTQRRDDGGDDELDEDEDIDPEPPLPTTPRRILFSVAKHWEQSFEEVQRWPWSMFCGAWADMIENVRRETLRDRRQKRKRREEQALADGHAEGRRLLAGGDY